METKDLAVHIDTLLSACVPHCDDEAVHSQCKNAYSIMSTFLDESMLKGYQFILYKIISRSYDSAIRISWKYIETLYSMNAKKFIRDRNVAIKQLFPEVKVSELADMEKERQLIGQLQFLLEQKYNEYAGKIVTQPEVNASLDILKRSMKEREIQEALMNATKILFQGAEIPYNGKTQYMQGGEDVLKYILSQCGSINNKYTDGDANLNWYHLTSYEDVLQMRESDNRSYDFVTDTGIPILDEHTGGMYTTQIFGVQGLPGVGKSRFCAKLMYRAKVMHGKNVMYTSMEQHCNELSMYFTSQHVWFKYGKYITDKQLKLHFVNQRRISKDKLTPEEILELAQEDELTEEEARIVEEAEFDFYSNPNYGQLLLDNSYVPVEKLESWLRHIHANVMKIDLFCLDHLSILTSDGSWTKGIKMTQTEIVTEAMKMLKFVCQRLNFLVLAVNQMTREEINRMLEGKTSRITGSANSSEFERSCDVIWNLGETEQMKEAGVCFLDEPKARDSGKPARVMLKAKKGICVYEQAAKQPDQNEV